MRKLKHASRRSSPRAALAILIIIAMLLMAAAPAMPATVEQFTDESTERTARPRPGEDDNGTRIAFDTDTRVRAASVLLKADQGRSFIRINTDGGNVTAWSAVPDTVDLSVLDPGPFMNRSFTQGDLNKVSLNASASSKATPSENVSAHLFAVDVGSVLGSVPRDTAMLLGWMGVGTQHGSVTADVADLYVADNVRGLWHRWGRSARAPSTGEHEYVSADLPPSAGWTNATGHMLVLAITKPRTAGLGSTLATSYFHVELWRTSAPADLAIDVGGDGTDEWAWSGEGVGLYGLQNALEDGSQLASVAFSGPTEHTNTSSFLVPAGADPVEARVTLAGRPGEVITSSDMAYSYVDANGMSSRTRVEGIPDYAIPTWARVELSQVKNAGKKDQSQETLRASQSIGNYGAGDTSVGQTFTPSISGNLVFINISIVKALGADYSEPHDIVVEIRGVDGNGHPSDVILGTSTLDGGLVNVSSANWHTVHFTDVPLAQGTQYAMVCSVPDAINLEYYSWNNHVIVAGDPYSGGKAFVSDTNNGTGPWLENANTDQAFITYMETDIGENVSLVRVAGTSYVEVIAGPMGSTYVYSVSGVTKNATGVWQFTVTNANDFPVSFNWTATVHSAVYPQQFGVRLSTEASMADFLSYAGPGRHALDGVVSLDFSDELALILDGAPVAYTAPNGVEFVRVNVSLRGNVTGEAFVTGLRVLYYLDMPIAGPVVTAAAEAFRAANAGQHTVEMPIVVSSSAPSRVLLADPYLEYDTRPDFNTQTQVIDEDGFEDVDLNSLFGDDYDNNNLTYEVVSVSLPADLEAVLNGTMLELTPAPDFAGELDVVVRGTDGSDLFTDGVIRVVVQAINDPPVIDVASPLECQAKRTAIFDLSANITDVDNVTEELELTTNSSFVTVSGLVLYCTFDTHADYVVRLTVFDGVVSTTADVTFAVSPAAGFPSIVGLPSVVRVHINRPLPMDLTQYGQDDEDDPSELVWDVDEESTLFDAAIDASGFNLTITPTGSGMGNGELYLFLTDTDGNTVSRRVAVNITERLKEAPRISISSLPDKLKLKEDGKAEVIRLEDHVEDDDPIASLTVQVAYSRAGIVYVDAQDGVLSFVPQAEGETEVTVTLIDSDGLSSFFSVDVEVEPKEEDGGFNWWVVVAVLFILAIIIVVVAWPRKATGTPGAAPRIVDEEVPHAPPPPRVEKVHPRTFRTAALRQLEGVMLFHRNGHLMAQLTRTIKEGVDRDVETAIIAKVQEQIKGRMRTREEPLDLIELHGMTVVIERGASVALAAVLTGEEPEALRKEMRKTLHEVQSRNADALVDWDGNLAELDRLDDSLTDLVENLIRAHKGPQDLTVDGEVLGGPRRPPKMEGVPELEDEEEPLKLVKDIIGEERTRELEEGHHHEETPEEGEEEGG